MAFIWHSRELGFSLEAIRELLGLSDRPERLYDAVDRLARRQLQQVEQRLARISVLMIEQFAGGRVRDCRIIEALSDHAY